MITEDMKVGAVVCQRHHPEWGFGVIRQKEEDAFGEVRFQVAFDHENQNQPCIAEDLLLCPNPAEAFSENRLGSVDVFRRKLLAGVILGENVRTGAFLRSALKPLPHQVHFLDRVLSGKRWGHLAADDVGLGKTIEAGLLIAHFYQETHPRRILILCPAGLALQWQDEMLDHFGLRFSVAGRDFRVDTDAGWENRSLVIGSIDTLKKAEYFNFIQKSGPFDLVVVDEAHRLSARREFFSGDLRTTESFRFVRQLVEEETIRFQTQPDGTPRSPRLLFLSATPHQGDDFRFALLLGLVRPDLFPGTEPDVVGHLTPENLMESVTKTPKSRAIDWDGKPIFKGHVTKTKETKRSLDEHAVAESLTAYIRKSISARHGGSRGVSLVIELVMHTLHKMAASSWIALESALSSRLDALRGRNGTPTTGSDDDEDQPGLSGARHRDPFYQGEESDLDQLVTAVQNLQTDAKWDVFREIIKGIEQAEKGAKVLIFTQYYATQEYLRDRLKELFPNDESVLINGGMGVEERKTARIAFEGAARFLISTEAGGEGVNFQKACHVMVNYDLPWNPMRLQQRIGRLDRYGQKRVVQVFNLSVDGSWDNRITLRIRDRLQAIQQTLGPVTDSSEDYWEMILGEVGEHIEPHKAFTEAVENGLEITDEEIEKRLREAMEAVNRTRELGVGQTSFQGLDHLPKPVLSSDDFREAFKECLVGHNIELRATRTSDKQWIRGVFQFVPPKGFREPRMRASNVRYVVFDKDRYAEVRGLSLGQARGQDINPELAGLGDAFTDWLFESAFVAKENEQHFLLSADSKWTRGPGWIRVAALRWRGALRHLKAPDSIMVLWIGDDGVVEELTFDRVAQLSRELIQGDTAGACDLAEKIPEAQGKNFVQTRLKELVGNDSEGKRLAGWSWLSLARVEAKGEVPEIAPDG